MSNPHTPSIIFLYQANSLPPMSLLEDCLPWKSKLTQATACLFPNGRTDSAYFSMVSGTLSTKPYFKNTFFNCLFFSPLLLPQNGLPSSSNPYVFNGDFVDRGKNSIEILMILCVGFLLYGDDLCLNRGNHEDFLMNMR